MENLLGKLAISQGNPTEALSHFDRGLLQRPNPEAALAQAASLASAGHYEEAVRHLDYYSDLPTPESPPAWNMQRVHAWVLKRQGFWPNQIRALRQEFVDEMNATSPHVGTSSR